MSEQVEQPNVPQDDAPSPLTQPADKKSGKRSKWLKGCGIGCGSVVVLAVVFGVAAYAWAMVKINRAQANMVQILNTDYPKWKAEGVVPKERVAAFDELAAWAGEENATTWKTALCFYAVGGACRDGEVDERELQQAAMIHDFLKQYPACTISEAGTFFWSSPNIQEGVRELVNEYASGAPVPQEE